MLQDGALARESINSDMHIERIETRPRIPLEAAAGSLSIITQSVSEYDCESFPVISRFPKYDFTIMVKGDSMEPEFCSGDEIACRFIERPSFIQWGRPHVLDTNQGVILKKYTIGQIRFFANPSTKSTMILRFLKMVFFMLL